MNREQVAHVQGTVAAKRGYERKSPYTNIRAERYWYAGFDGIPYKEVK